MIDTLRDECLLKLTNLHVIFQYNVRRNICLLLAFFVYLIQGDLSHSRWGTL